MIDFDRIREALSHAGLEKWAEQLVRASQTVMAPSRHGNIEKWQNALNDLPQLTPTCIDLTAGTVQIGGASDNTLSAQAMLEQNLLQLSPWRKGPFDIHGVRINTEWRSDWKWNRVQPHLQSLQGRRVLDVGCGNGYHAWRMIGDGASFVLGIDPTPLYLAQFAAVSRFAPGFPVHMLPLDDEALPDDMAEFDTVFSMGVLYHRRSPLDHILKLRSLLRPGGELVLETLVIAGDATHALVPRDRYAKMRNVWFIPSCAMLEIWLNRCGFKNVRTVDVTPTTTQEQHSTHWMSFESLSDFLNPINANQTVEGYPAPTRAITIANAP